MKASRGKEGDGTCGSPGSEGELGPGFPNLKDGGFGFRKLDLFSGSLQRARVWTSCLWEASGD